MQSNIKIRTFVGKAIRPYLTAVGRLRIDVFRDWPYLYSGKLEDESKHLKKFSQAEDAIFVLVFDGSTIVGASTGMPFDTQDPRFQQPFIDHHKVPSDFFYFGESVLLKPYRGRGIGHHFFEEREAHARLLKRFKYTCFCCVVRPEKDLRRPVDYMPLDDFWRKRGYVQHKELTCTVPWIDVDSENESNKTFVFWIKAL